MKCLLLFLCVTTSLFSEIKAVVFDYGGVIGTADREKLIAFLSTSLSLSREEAIEIGRGWKRAVVCGDKKEELYFQEALAAYGKQVPAGWVATFDEKLLENIFQDPRMLALVKSLQQEGYKTPLFSNVSESFAAVLRKKGCYAPFHPVVLSYEIGVEKPALESYNSMLSKVGLAPDEIIFIDDRLDNVEAAKTVGIDAIHFTEVDALKQELAKRAIKIFSH